MTADDADFRGLEGLRGLQKSKSSALIRVIRGDLELDHISWLSDTDVI